MCWLILYRIEATLRVWCEWRLPARGRRHRGTLISSWDWGLERQKYQDAVCWGIPLCCCHRHVLLFFTILCNALQREFGIMRVCPGPQTFPFKTYFQFFFTMCWTLLNEIVTSCYKKLWQACVVVFLIVFGQMCLPQSCFWKQKSFYRLALKLTS